MNSLPLLASVIPADAAIPLWLAVPFALLLLLIAVMPLSPARIKHFWEHYYPHVAIGLGLCVVAFYLFRIPLGGSLVLGTVTEYFSFIALIGSLFVVSGGIHINVKGNAKPWTNVIFLGIGAVVANLIGTTGASMVLIRPFIRMNKSRISAYHIVFFIFLVSNCGGSLTPIGDPPLFLGYLRGVPFFWLFQKVILQWAFTIGLILIAFYFFDRRGYRLATIQTPAAAKSEVSDGWRFEGGINVLFLLVIIGSVFLPEKFFLREIVMLGSALLSYKFTPKTVHQENEFSFGPIKEVAFLFAGIFLTMMPALGYLQQNGKDFGFNKPTQYYFSSGALSSVLDNAPTYLNFLQLAEATFVDRATLAKNDGAEVESDAGVKALLSSDKTSIFVIAVSLGSVFFGAMTYIGNGPNFMVKSIADSSGVKTPTFFGYIFKYSLPVLLPILAISGFLFLR
jgi:Na+/H+ antiporter NhaD/arsenite permease-like protein